MTKCSDTFKKLVIGFFLIASILIAIFCLFLGLHSYIDTTIAKRLNHDIELLFGESDLQPEFELIKRDFQICVNERYVRNAGTEPSFVITPPSEAELSEIKKVVYAHCAKRHIASASSYEDAKARNDLMRTFGFVREDNENGRH